ncbi:NDMA-dependent alcohol dehydrogenase [Actinomycetospora sp. C-140]
MTPAAGAGPVRHRAGPIEIGAAVVLTEAGVLWKIGEPWSVEEIELGDPVPGEVQVKLAATGLCHSDDHLRTGDMPSELPLVGGHEGAGVVTAVGAGVTSVEEGDHIVLAFIPACGRCKFCSRGQQNLCDFGAQLMTGAAIADGTYRAKARGQNLGRACQLGTFSRYVTVHESSVVKIPETMPLRQAALLGCGVTTGWASAVYAGDVEPGDIVVVIGMGGIGTSAVQGARIAGASAVVVVDPSDFKRESATTFGATHVARSTEEARAIIAPMSNGQGADKVVVTVGLNHGDELGDAMSLVSKGGKLVLTAITPMHETKVTLGLMEMTLWQKSLVGTLFGSANPRVDIPKLCQLYLDGQLLLDEMITRTYELDELNQGYEDMLAAKNIRGLVVLDPSL